MERAKERLHGSENHNGEGVDETARFYDHVVERKKSVRNLEVQ